MFRAFAPILALVLTSSLIHASTSEPISITEIENSIFHRLPTNVIPKHYDLLLDVSEAEVITGKVIIDFLVRGMPIEHSTLPSCLGGAKYNGCHHEHLRNAWRRNQLVLNVDQNVEILSAEYTRPSRLTKSWKTIPISKILFNKEYQTLWFNFEHDLKPMSEGKLEIRFRTRYSEDLRGIYKRSYSDGRVERRYVANSFQPSDARRVFPCFDEPNFKTNFTLRLMHHYSDSALSTTPVASRHELHNGKLAVTEFQQTKPMPVHMLGFVVGHFSFIERKNVGKNGIPVRVYTPLNLHESGRYALDVATKALEYMEAHLDYAYPLEKFDIVSLPDRDKDNTESWGMAVIRSNVSLFDESDSRQDSKLTIAVNVAHVVVHQWFANLVTPSWWDQLWITEGIASMKAFDIVEELFPEYDGRYFVRMSTLSNALISDNSNAKVHAISPGKFRGHIETSEEIYGLFDLLEFMKSGSLMQLLKNRLGAMRFRDTLRVLVQQKAYDLVDIRDLEDALLKNNLGTSKQVDIKEFTQQIYYYGYPTIEIDIGRKNTRIRLSGDHDLDELTLSAMFGDASSNKTEIIEMSRDNLQMNKPVWFDPYEPSIYFKMNPSPDISTWSRVDYSDAFVETSFKNSIGKKYLEAYDRFHVLEDAVGLVLAGRKSPQSLAKLLAVYEHEDHDGVILEILVADEVLKAHNIHEQDTMINKIVLGVYERYGFQSEAAEKSFLSARVQTAVLSALVQKGNQQVIEAALKKYDEAKEHLAVHLRDPVYSAVAKYGSGKQNEELVVRLNQVQAHEEKLRLIKALLTSRQPSSFVRFSQVFKKIYLPKEVRLQFSSESLEQMAEAFDEPL